MKKRHAGFTMAELVIVLAVCTLLSSVTISSFYYIRRTKEYEQKIVEMALQDAMVGYYGLTGTYPISPSTRLTVGAVDQEIENDEVRWIAEELRKYLGYTFFQASEFETFIKRYEFKCDYPNKYVFKVKVGARSR